MPTYRKGDYWDEYDQSDLFLFTSNGVLKDDRLIMGAGTAQQARDRFPGIDLAIGRKLMSDFDYEGKPIIYGLLISDRWPVGKVGAFQTKLHWRQDSDLDLIKFSINLLDEWCHKNSAARVDLPFPGIGCGNLKRETVLEYLEALPNKVNVWER
jgi:hypothetical protein